MNWKYGTMGRPGFSESLRKAIKGKDADALKFVRSLDRLGWFLMRTSPKRSAIKGIRILSKVESMVRGCEDAAILPHR